MKNKIIKMISTNNIVAFATGVIFTIFFNLIVNKEPFEINSDSVSALANVGTFLVALIAALQVKKWLNSKINETAFKKSEEFISELTKFNYRLSVALNCIKSISDMQSDEDFISFKEELALLHGLSYKELESLFTSIDLFNNWGIEFMNHKEIDEGLDSAGYSVGATEKLIEITNSVDDLEEFMEHDIDVDFLSEKLSTTITIFSDIIKTPFTEKFKFT
ncbi:hypothetical protein RI049_15230 [Cedecea neteri]|uniref:hypothetical protein n=1 Tax=Cedecea neteri TaxID=158822 RepID=UPI002AA8D2F0|nr:hypothetical protein [Cedecea neteri]WPU21430.1 hypothetical protein RI049_15230 [Cedecea neteri]